MTWRRPHPCEQCGTVFQTSTTIPDSTLCIYCRCELPREGDHTISVHLNTEPLPFPTSKE